MENKLKLNFLPTYGHRYFMIAFIGLLFSTVLLLVSSLLKVEFINIYIIKWILAFSLSVMAFSKERSENRNHHDLKYYSGKIAIILLIGFTLAINATELLTKRVISIDTINLIIGGLVSYTAIYQILKFLAKSRQVQIEETSFPDNLKYNSTLSTVIFILSIITFILVLLVG